MVTNVRIMNVWLCPAFREIDLVDEVIYCTLMPVTSLAQMEVVLRSDLPRAQ